MKLTEKLTAMTTKTVNILCCHRALYGGMAGLYGWAATQSHDPGIYIILAVLHAILAIRR
jgi:hypothetical protein